MERELRRLVLREGFVIRAGSWEAEPAYFAKADFPTMPELRRFIGETPQKQWAGFQVYYPMPENEVRSATGVDLVESMLAVFKEVTAAMNLCMQTRLQESMTSFTE